MAKLIIAGLACAALVAASANAQANDKYLAGEAVTVQQLKGALPTSAAAAEWQKIAPATIVAASQRTVLMIDRDANESRNAPPTLIEARALSNGTHLGLHLSWPDASEDRAAFGATRSFGDSIAIEVPIAFGAGKRMPYVGMGDPEAHVLVSMQRATYANELGLKASRTGTYVGAGFGSLTRADLRWMAMDMQYDAKAKRWNAQFVRPWKTEDHDMQRALVPFAIAVWNGDKLQRGGNKSISRWRVLHNPAHKAEPAYLKELSYGYNQGEMGNAVAGKALVDAICAACHRFGDKAYAPPQMAPDLSNIGVISTHAYLRNSLTKPSQVIVPVLNLNRHYSKSKPRDRYGAHQNDMTYQWFTLGPDGAKTSRMPPFVFPPEQTANIIAYLKSLGAAMAPKTGAPQ